MSGRFWIAVPLCFGVLSAASGEISSACNAAAAPSRFDYQVLASIADSQRPFWMATYHPARGHDSLGTQAAPGRAIR
jgi:hypothetical protein